jgi:hypothetical protein
MHAYVDQLDFTGMHFDEAIRHFLQGFRLPGEAQKIDRMMEKFAERFCINNPDVRLSLECSQPRHVLSRTHSIVRCAALNLRLFFDQVFPNADTGFVLAYSVIMLNTDAHNPNIKQDRRMTREGFISNNRGIAAGQDLPRELLIGIYDSIVSRPITLKEDDKRREKQQVCRVRPVSWFTVQHIAILVTRTLKLPAHAVRRRRSARPRSKSANCRKRSGWKWLRLAKTCSDPARPLQLRTPRKANRRFSLATTCPALHCWSMHA